VIIENVATDNLAKDFIAYPLSDAPLALSDLLAGKIFGKLVLTP
jgi:hypothetical protein